MAIYRQDILKYLTERPHQVVTKEEITQAGNWRPAQVSAAILRLQNESPLGTEIETVVRGNAWRYVPRQPITTTTTATAPNPNLPVTTLIREYLLNHPHELVSVEQLAAYTGKRLDQVKVGINNMRRIRSNQDVTTHLTPVVYGQVWRFDPPADWQRPGGQQQQRQHVPTSPLPAPVASVVPSVPVAARSGPSPNGQASTIIPDDVPVRIETRVFEEVGGFTDGRVLVRDEDDNLYTLTPING